MITEQTEPQFRLAQLAAAIAAGILVRHPEKDSGEIVWFTAVFAVQVAEAIVQRIAVISDPTEP